MLFNKIRRIKVVLTFSILYDNGSGFDAAVDWNREKQQWDRSERLGLGGSWETYPGLDEQAYRALMERFGLSWWVEEFPMERIAFMSPKALDAERRKKEKDYSLPTQRIISDTMGAPVPASTTD